MNEAKPWTPSSIVLILAGVALIGTGFYFIVLRPALLPEDVRYMALPAAQFDILRPRLEAWLTQVFRVIGGYVLATGVLAVTWRQPHSARIIRGGDRRGDRRRGLHRLDGRREFHDRLGLQMGAARDGVVVGVQPRFVLDGEQSLDTLSLYQRDHFTTTFPVMPYSR